jgi:regulator of protease activity HflC (stomatin/prohibitin superfamily)
MKDFQGFAMPEGIVEYATEMMGQAGNKLTELVVALIGLITYLLPLVILGFVGKHAIELAKKYWVEGKANEWILVIRNGVLVKKGVGMATLTMPGDQVVKFPTMIGQVNFIAEQVSSEMQGVRVTGMLIWSVYRDEDGPFRCYKAFGDDLLESTGPSPSVANQNMAVSIIRDRIANLTINDILKNRSKLRNGVKEEMQKIIHGWGIWLETCEVQDVKISSKSLFTNLQTEFREKSRQVAEKISSDTEKIIQEEAMVRKAEMDKLTAETNTATSLMQQ